MCISRVCVYIYTSYDHDGVVEISIRALLPYTPRIIYLAMAFTETYHSYLDHDWRSLASFLKAINPPADLPQNIESRPYRTHTLLCGPVKIKYSSRFVSSEIFLSAFFFHWPSHYLFEPYTYA